MSFEEKIKHAFKETLDSFGDDVWKHPFGLVEALRLDVLAVYAEDQKELIKTILKELDIVDEFAFLVKEYALVDNSKLTKDAIELKHRILKVLEIGQEERKQKLLEMVNQTLETLRKKNYPLTENKLLKLLRSLRSC